MFRIFKKTASARRGLRDKPDQCTDGSSSSTLAEMHAAFDDDSIGRALRKESGIPKLAPSRAAWEISRNNIAAPHGVHKSLVYVVDIPPIWNTWL